MKASNLINSTVGKNITRLRKKAGFNHEELAGALGLIRTSVVNIEKGRQALTVENLIKICAVLKCGVTDILPNIPRATINKLTKKTKPVLYNTLQADFEWDK